MQDGLANIRQASNLFVFVMNNPINFIDPSGLFAVPIRPFMTSIGGNVGAFTCFFSGMVYGVQASRPGFRPQNYFHMSRDDIFIQNGRNYVSLSTLVGDFISTPRQASRSSWTSTVAPNWGPLGDPTGIVIHHTVGALNITDASGSGGNAYHFIISGDGTIIEGIPITQRGGANTTGYNVGLIHIAVTGNTNENPGGMPTQAQMASMFWLINRELTNHPTITNVRGHQDSPGQSTGCPGYTFVGFIRDVFGDFRP